MSLYLVEKEYLIGILITLYPYPPKWFYRKEINQLRAMLNNYRPQKKKKEPVINRELKIRNNEETGELEVLTDSGQWEKYID